MDRKLAKLVHDSTPETLEQHVLQHVRFRPCEDNYEILDLSENIIAVVPRSTQGTWPHVIAEALLKKIICAGCGGKLLNGEEDICTLCEARQVCDLRSIVKDLL